MRGGGGYNQELLPSVIVIWDLQDNTPRVSQEGGGEDERLVLTDSPVMTRDTFKDTETDGAVDAYRRGSNTSKG